jgi:hypothetical protein
VGEAAGVAVNVGKGVRVGMGVGDSCAPPNRPQPVSTIAAATDAAQINILGRARFRPICCLNKAILTSLWNNNQPADCIRFFAYRRNMHPAYYVIHTPPQEAGCITNRYLIS